MNTTLRLHLSAMLFDCVSSGMMLMALPWMILSGGSEGTFLALVTLICTALSFVFTPVFAAFIDRYSRRQILTLVQCVQLSAAAIIIVSVYSGIFGNWTLAVALISYWLSNDLAWGAGGAFTQELYKKEEYASVSAKQEVTLQITTLTAGGLGVFLLESWKIEEFATLAMLLSSLSFLCYRAISYRPQNTARQRHSFSQQLTEVRSVFSASPAFFIFIAMSCLSYPMMTYLAKLVPIYLSEQGEKGSWFAWWQINYGLGAIVCGLVITRLLSKFEYEKLMMVCMLTLCLLLAVMTVQVTPLAIVCLALPIGLFNATNRIARVNKLHIAVDNAVRGRIDGGMKLFTTLAQSLSYVLIAYLSHQQITVYGFAIAAVTMGLALVVMISLYRTGIRGAKQAMSSQTCQ